ncbi:MAG: alpha/beta fold hydrolase [Acidimicrobiia bacterium]
MGNLVESKVATPAGKISVLRGGAGDPVVYFHSAAGEAVHPALEDLADDHDVIVPLFPGFGESEGIEAIDDIEDAAFHLLDVLDALELSAPAVVGLSLGGWLAAELATRSPERVGKLVLVSPVGLHIDGEPVGQIFGRSPAELAGDLFADQSHPMAQMMCALSEKMGDLMSMAELPIALLMPMWASMSATAKIGWNPYLHNPKLRSRLRRVTAPTLVVAGERDGLVPRAHPQAYADGIAGARLEVMEGAGHMAPLERPGEFAALVRTFLGG